MADRNERHFLEFYTPARQRIAARRRANTEHQQRQRTPTPFSDDKENPINDQGVIGAAPATIPGEKAVGGGRQRRRLFTRSASKQKCADIDNGGNDDGVGTNSNAAHTSRSLTKDLKLVQLPASGFESPPLYGSTVSRALFSTNGNTTPVTDAIEENSNSPPETSNLLNEYRSKQSLLSSSKTRISQFSSPISGGLRLRPSSLWKVGKVDKISEEDQKTNPNDSPLVAAIETSKTRTIEVTHAGIEATAPACSSLHEGLSTESSNNSIVDTTSPSTNLSPITPKTTPRRSIFWSPPGTSRLLRKYRQRTEQLDQDPYAFQSPPDVEPDSRDNYDRSQTTPRGRRGIRMLDSGAKRYRNHRFSLRPRPAANEVTTPANAKIRARVKTSAKAKDSSKMAPNNGNRSLLSPSTAKRLNKDIDSYRQAHGQAKESKISVTEKESSELDETNIDADRKDNSDGSKREVNDNFVDHTVDEGLELTPFTHLSPALSVPGNAEGDIEDPTINENIANSLPFDEITEDILATTTKSPEAVVTNPSDEDATQIGIFRSTRSASRVRHQFMLDAMKSPSSSDTTAANVIKVEENESSVFRSTRSATRAHLKSLHDAVEANPSANATPVYSSDGEDEGSSVFRSTCSATSARRKSTHDEVEGPTTMDTTPLKSKDGEEECSGVYRSTRSATHARRKSIHVAVEAPTTTDVTPMKPKGGEVEYSAVFRSTRSAARARRKSMIDAEKAVSAAEKAVSAAETAISGKSGINTIENSHVVDAAACDDPNVGLSELTLPLPPQDGDNSPSSKGSLKSIWDVLHCGVGEKSIDSTPSENSRDSSSVHANIVSRVGDCVNPVATTLMKMWREEEKAAVEHKKEIQASQEVNENNTKTAVALPITVMEDNEGETLPPPLCALKASPPKSFSSDLNLVYGLERVQNLTLARPKALQATRSMNGESLSIASTGFTIPALTSSRSQ